MKRLALDALIMRAGAASDAKRKEQRRRADEAFEELLRSGTPESWGSFLASIASRRSFVARSGPTRSLILGAAQQVGNPLNRARLMRASSRRPYGVRHSGSLPRLLVLERSGMDQDLQHGLLDQAWPGTLIPIPRSYLKRIGATVLEDPTGDFRYLASTTPESRSQLREILSGVLEALFERCQSRTLLSANIAYWSDQELGEAAHEAGGRHLVLHKESLITSTPASFASYSEALRKGVVPSSHRRIAVYSESTAAAFLAAGVAEPEQIEVVGAARLDAAHFVGKKRASTVSRRHVTFFSFHDWIGISFPEGPDDSASKGLFEPMIRWTQMIAGFYEAAELLARSRTDIITIVKHKAGLPADTRPEARGSVQKRPQVVSGGKAALDLLEGSAVCVAFNSTIILEALAARVPVIVPAFGEANVESAKQYIIDFGPTVHHAESPAKMADMAAWFVDNPSAQLQDITPAASEALSRLVANPDGASGKRLQRFLAERQTP